MGRAFSYTHPHTVTGSLTLLQLLHKLGIPAAGCQLCTAPPWRFPASLWPWSPHLYKEVGLGHLPGPFRSHKLALTPHSGEGQELQASWEKLGKSEARRPRQTHSQAEMLRKAGACKTTETAPGADVRTWRPTNLRHRIVEPEGVQACYLQTARLSPPAPVPCPPLRAPSLFSSDRLSRLARTLPCWPWPAQLGLGAQPLLTIGVPPGGGAGSNRKLTSLCKSPAWRRTPASCAHPRCWKLDGATPGLYSPPASCRRCASGPPRRSGAHGRPLLHAPEPGGQVWARPMGPPAPRRAAPGRLRARCLRTPSTALRPGAPEKADNTAPALRAPAPGPWSQESLSRPRPCLALFLLPPKGRSKKRQREMIKLLEAGR